MHPWYVPIEAETIRRLYLDDRLTTSQIAAVVGCSEMTIRRRLQRFGIRPRRRGPAAKRYDSVLRWTPALAYAVGLIATDGNLSRDGRHLAIPSKDLALLQCLRRCLGLTNGITRYRSGRGGMYYKLQWSDRVLYDWLGSIGLTPAKSLTLGALAIPNEYFADFFRGCIDGDGSIITYTDRYHAAKNPRYVYERLYVKIVSASCPFATWLRALVHELTGANGDLTVRRPLHPHHHPIWCLRYAKKESLRVLGWMYYAPNIPCLVRKRAIAERFISRLDPEYSEPGEWRNLATADDSKSSARKGVGVQIPSPLPTTYIDGLV
jgi:Homeodomain-like domain-containing protein